MRSLNGLSDQRVTVVGRWWAHAQWEAAEQQEELRTVTVSSRSVREARAPASWLWLAVLTLYPLGEHPGKNCINLESLMFCGGSELSRTKMK